RRRRRLPLPDPVLLAMPGGRRCTAGLRERGRVRRLPAALLVHPVRRADPAVPAAVPADLLLLPARLLPRVLGLAAGLRRTGRAPAVLRRDPVAAGLPYSPPVQLLRGRRHLADQLIRLHRHPPRQLPPRLRPGQPGAAIRRGVAVLVHAVLPL